MIAVCIGHSRLVNGRVEGGAVSTVPEQSEHAYNSRLGALVVEGLRAVHGREAILIDRYQGHSYSSAMKWLGGELDRRGVDLAVELHFNSAESPLANGHEWLYWHASPQGKRAALFLHHEMSKACLFTSRGTKGLGPLERGADFLRLTPCPAVICEPFFGSSPADWDTARAKMPRIAAAIASALASVTPSARPAP